MEMSNKVDMSNISNREKLLNEVAKKREKRENRIENLGLALVIFLCFMTIAVPVGVIGTILYVAIHFIVKWW